MMIMPVLEMPAVNTDYLSREDSDYVRKALDEVRGEDTVGIQEEPFNSLPIYIHDEKEPLGYTKIGYDRRYGIIPTEIGISRHAKNKKRVVKHELRHARSTKLLKYADVPEPLARLVMESYPEYGGIIASRDREKEEILSTTPYGNAIQFGVIVDKYYMSNRDGKKGYAAFIRDIYRNKSMAMTFQTLERCMKYAQN